MRVILIEDEPDLGTAIKQILHQEKYIVDWVTNGDDAWAYLEDRHTQYTIGIFDWLIPGLSGLELLKRLRAKNNPLPVLMLTARDSMEDRVRGLDEGADDYLVKPFGIAELLARLRALQRRTPQIQAQKLEINEIVLDYNTRTIYHLKETISLTNKEFQVLEYLMRHPNQIITTEQLRNQLWEMGADSFSNVVAAQVRLLRRKLESIGCSNLIETVYGVGYRLNNHAAK